MNVPCQETASNSDPVPSIVDESDVSSSPEKSRRNLTQAFDALLVSGPDKGLQLESIDVLETVIPLPTYGSVSSSDKKGSLVSPTSVADFGLPVILDASEDGSIQPEQSLHPDLQRELSVHCICRVSRYSIIHDINKECSAMAQNDPLFNSSNENYSPLVLSARESYDEVPETCDPLDPSKVQLVVIDEERWLLSVIASRTAQETHSVVNSDCPSTFLQAMGEKEYDNPVHSVTGQSRTQLWKPSRSWWEAKSGKNPWIEPTCHNKRWRYLWPLIHYHKFLAKCIKKLKRNGVDVKMSISPVSVFLREEVCAISDHLAAVSLFDSDEWMACLQYFDGWTDDSPEAEQVYRAFVQKLPLRGLDEPGDVDSPLLRSQIDESFLRAMAAQREQFREANGGITVSSSNNPVPTKKSTIERIHMDHPADVSGNLPSHGQQPLYHRVSPQHNGIPRQIHGVRRPRFFPQSAGWYGWECQPFQDNSSVHSELSANSFPQQSHRYDFHTNASGVYPISRSGHVPPGYYPAVGNFPGSAEHSLSSDGFAYANNGYHDPTMGWIHPYMGPAYVLQNHQQSIGYFGHPVPASQPMASPSTTFAAHEAKDASEVSTSVQTASIELPNEEMHRSEATPLKYDPDCSITQSPYWSHLDQGTIAMGLATPAKPPTPMTPLPRFNDDENEVMTHMKGESTFTATAQAPLLRQHYYSHGNYNLSNGTGAYCHDGYVPSPATQFMMSPHAHLATGFAYNYGYGFSPRRNGRGASSTPRNIANKTIPEKAVTSSPLDASKLVQRRERHSPSTVETTTDSESFIEPQAAVLLGGQR